MENSQELHSRLQDGGMETLSRVESQRKSRGHDVEGCPSIHVLAGCGAKQNCGLGDMCWEEEALTGISLHTAMK